MAIATYARPELTTTTGGKLTGLTFYRYNFALTMAGLLPVETPPRGVGESQINTRGVAMRYHGTSKGLKKFLARQAELEDYLEAHEAEPMEPLEDTGASRACVVCHREIPAHWTSAIIRNGDKILGVHLNCRESNTTPWNLCTLLQSGGN